MGKNYEGKKSKEPIVLQALAIVLIILIAVFGIMAMTSDRHRSIVVSPGDKVSLERRLKNKAGDTLKRPHLPVGANHIIYYGRDWWRFCLEDDCFLYRMAGRASVLAMVSNQTEQLILRKVK
jgi:hypothetical protein